MALCAPYDKTGIDQVQAERLSMSWIERIKSNITPTRKASIPEGVWTKCDSCGQVLYRAELERNLEVCPKCDHHMRMSARNRLHSLLDEGSPVELGSELEPKDVLKFRDSKKYKDRLASAQKRPVKRCAGGHEGHSARDAGCRSSIRILLYGRLDGLGCWRSLRARGRTGAGR